MSEVTKQSKINMRAIVSMSMLFSFVWLPLSGIIIHITERDGMTQLRHGAMAVHNFASIVFFISSLVHITLNMKTIKQYVIVRAGLFQTVRKETIIAFVVTTLIIGFFASHVFHVH